MRENGKRWLIAGIGFIAAFVLLTALLLAVDVRPVGQNGTDIGFAAINRRFHEITGVHMAMYTATDWLGLVPVFVCMLFGSVGLAQWIRRRSLARVDCDILLLGVYYVVVILCYLVFEMIPVNYRPVPIEGRMEASYPSSTTLLVLCVMPTLSFQARRRLKQETARQIAAASGLFSAFVVAGRLISGVHWLTDIVGSVMLSTGLFCMYRAAVLLCGKTGE